MHKPPPVSPIIGAAGLAERLSRLHRLPAAATRPAAAWLRAPQEAALRGDWPELLQPYRALCPDPAALLRLIAFFGPVDAPAPGGNALLAHLRGGWQDGRAPAPWFDPMGYEVLSAGRRAPEEAAILHYARQGWAQRLDPDPRRTCDLSRLGGHSLVLHADTDAQSAAVLAWLTRHLEGAAAPGGPEWILLDTGAGHDSARAAARRQAEIERRRNEPIFKMPDGRGGIAIRNRGMLPVVDQEGRTAVVDALQVLVEGLIGPRSAEVRALSSTSGHADERQRDRHTQHGASSARIQRHVHLLPGTVRRGGPADHSGVGQTSSLRPAALTRLAQTRAAKHFPAIVRTGTPIQRASEAVVWAP